MQKSPLQGSERQPLEGARLLGPADPAEQSDVTLILRHNAAGALQDRVQRLTRGDYSLMPLTREAYATAHGAAQADIDAVKAFATASNLAVVSTDAGRRAITLSGSIAALSAAFDVTLQQYDHPDGAYRGRTGAVHLPDSLKDIVTAVMGLDNRPQARAHFRRTAAPVPQDAAPPPVSNVSYAPITVARLYGFPRGTGAGQTIGLIELGGGTRPDDLTAYFATFGLTAPKMVTVSVDKGLDQATGSVDGPDGEVMLDVEVAGAVAPGATLVTYFTPNTSAGFIDAVSTAVHDAVNKPSVISISWGSAECNWTGQAMQAMDEAFQAAAAMGVTICVAAGDHGSSDEVADGGNHVDFPASSPHVLACGGTSLQARSGMIVSETVWNDGAGHGATGGGISAVFERPVWQHGLAATLTAGGTVPLNRRGVPDVSGDADPKTGYQVRVDGSNVIIGGTSAVAPLWAALIARLNEANPGRTAGFINPLLYKNRHALHDTVEGNNGTYAAAPGWDACTGLGSPKGGALAAVVGNHIKTSTNIPMKETKMTEKTHTHDVAKPDGVVFSGNNAIAQPDGVVFSGNSEIAAPNGVVFSGNSEIASPAGVVFSGNDEVATPNGVVFSGNDEPANHS